ncbi:ATP-binding cassette domain-containing protein, partial [Clostridium saudiense]|nr:ATP-binding cassette domain-containing protein [Clostridium saudiense]
DNSIGELSGGERRMVYLGRVLMQKCKIILLDEPNTFLDYVRQHDFFTFIRRLIKEKNLIALFTIHDINLALRYGDRIHILDENKIIDVVNCRESGYEKRILESLKKIYKRDFSIVDTKEGPMIIC